MTWKFRIFALQSFGFERARCFLLREERPARFRCGVSLSAPFRHRGGGGLHGLPSGFGGGLGITNVTFEVRALFASGNRTPNDLPSAIFNWGYLRNA